MPIRRFVIQPFREDTMVGVAMDVKFAVAFWLMSLASHDYEGNNFSARHADEAHKFVFSQGFLQSRGRTIGAEARVSYTFDRVFNRFNPIADLSVGTGGATFVGFGLYHQTDIDLGEATFYTGSFFIPGLYLHGNGFDLGYPLEFRSGVEVGYRAQSGLQFSLSYDHRSNAGLGSKNPGIESIQFRLWKSFE